MSCDDPTSGAVTQINPRKKAFDWVFHALQEDKFLRLSRTKPRAQHGGEALAFCALTSMVAQGRALT